MITHGAAPGYRAYLLRFWQERSGSAGGTAVWRFSLEDPRTGARRGFATLEEVIIAVQREMGDQAGQSKHGPLGAPLPAFVSIEEQTMSSDTHAEDETAIRAIVRQIQQGWNAGDGTAFAAPFAEDADYVIVDGRYVKGRRIIEQGHKQIFATIYKGSNNTGTVQSVRFIRDDVAVVHVEWHLKLRSDDASEAKAMNTMVMTKDHGEWRIAAFHNTRIAAQEA